MHKSNCMRPVIVTRNIINQPPTITTTTETVHGALHNNENLVRRTLRSPYVAFAGNYHFQSRIIVFSFENEHRKFAGNQIIFIGIYWRNLLDSQSKNRKKNPFENAQTIETKRKIPLGYQYSKSALKQTKCFRFARMHCTKDFKANKKKRRKK